MALVTMTSRVMAAALLAAPLLTACTDGDPVPSASPSPSPSPEVVASEPVAPTEADDLDALLVMCREAVTPPTERALAAARRSAGVADPHEAGEDGDGSSSPSTGDAARREARREVRLATDAVAACLRRTAELADAASPTPDRRLELLRTRLRDLGRALSSLERGLQADSSLHEPADDLVAALARWRQVTQPTRPEPSEAPS